MQSLIALSRCSATLEFTHSVVTFQFTLYHCELSRRRADERQAHHKLQGATNQGGEYLSTAKLTGTNDLTRIITADELLQQSKELQKKVEAILQDPLMTKTKEWEKHGWNPAIVAEEIRLDTVKKLLPNVEKFRASPQHRLYEAFGKFWKEHYPGSIVLKYD
ncbi:hypothetical protein PHYSODRAFT_305703 [Phytophthora sojae]|uniref:Uncharacterized protein n=1 Tax=Phytophthora sojae (strain P6497) TaxID=1094619 RepID=G5A668_PHYSP|nr:hypothetical protein PHYSODRAFT_305703 [Phytophthora sojae]EGZ08823.1 hypothetical protein PHYSODRAFT_305703 [Phytophthora sojae]|eukprot:XP_009535456.1 hypothetical protein PHYSODRAFT_305703 [Phytophthora sojae]